MSRQMYDFNGYPVYYRQDDNNGNPVFVNDNNQMVPLDQIRGLNQQAQPVAPMQSSGTYVNPVNYTKVETPTSGVGARFNTGNVPAITNNRVEIVEVEKKDFIVNESFIDVKELSIKNIVGPVEIADFNSIIKITDILASKNHLASYHLIVERVGFNIEKEEIEQLLEFLSSIQIVDSLKNDYKMSKELDEIVCDIVNTLLPNITIMNFYTAAPALVKHLKKTNRDYITLFINAITTALEEREELTIHELTAVKIKEHKFMIRANLQELTIELKGLTYAEVDIPDDSLLLQVLKVFKRVGITYLYDANEKSIFEVKNNGTIRRVYSA